MPHVCPCIESDTPPPPHTHARARNRRYHACTTVDNGQTPWCATTADYDIDKKWGACNPDACRNTCLTHSTCYHQWGDHWCATAVQDNGMLQAKELCQMQCNRRHPKYGLVFPALKAVAGRVVCQGMSSISALSFPLLESIGKDASPGSTRTWIQVQDNSGLNRLDMPRLVSIARTQVGKLIDAPSIACAAASKIPRCTGETGANISRGYLLDTRCVAATVCVGLGHLPVADGLRGAVCSQTNPSDSAKAVVVQANPALKMLVFGTLTSLVADCSTSTATTTTTFTTADTAATAAVPSTTPKMTPASTSGISSSFRVHVNALDSGFRFNVGHTAWSVLLSLDMVFYDKDLNGTADQGFAVSNIDGTPLPPGAVVVANPESYVLDVSSIKTKTPVKPYFRGAELSDSAPAMWRLDYHKGGSGNAVYTTVMSGGIATVAGTANEYLLEVDQGLHWEVEGDTTNRLGQGFNARIALALAAFNTMTLQLALDEKSGTIAANTNGGTRNVSATATAVSLIVAATTAVPSLPTITPADDPSVLPCHAGEQVFAQGNYVQRSYLGESAYFKGTVTAVRGNFMDVRYTLAAETQTLKNLPNYNVFARDAHPKDLRKGDHVFANGAGRVPSVYDCATSSDTCLQAQVGWSTDDTCASAAKDYCGDSKRGDDIRRCCPSACAALNVSLATAPCVTNISAALPTQRHSVLDCATSSNACLQAQPAWSTSDTCSASAEKYCADAEWGRDMRRCCPSVCAALNVSLATAPCNTGPDDYHMATVDRVASGEIRVTYPDGKKKVFDSAAGSGRVLKVGRSCGTCVSSTAYRGPLAETKLGDACQRWSEQSPNSHDYPSQDYPDAGLASNACRDPGGDGYLWCYGMAGERWEMCNHTAANICPDATPTPVPSPTGNATKDCVDDETDCAQYYAKQGFCKEESEHYTYMKQSCPKACGFCQPDGNSCTDDTVDCALYYAIDGYCEKDSEHYAYMQQSCPKACGFCSPADDGGAASTLTVAKPSIPATSPPCPVMRRYQAPVENKKGRARERISMANVSSTAQCAQACLVYVQVGNAAHLDSGNGVSDTAEGDVNREVEVSSGDNHVHCLSFSFVTHPSVTEARCSLFGVTSSLSPARPGRGWAHYVRTGGCRGAISNNSSGTATIPTTTTPVQATNATEPCLPSCMGRRGSRYIGELQCPKPLKCTP